MEGMIMFLNRKYAFTLAEVLVTLGIIGVVSAMTVPSLMQNYQKQSYVTQLHKVYNELTQGFMQIVTDRNALNLAETGITRAQDMMPLMKKYFKVVQDCDTTPTPCFADTYRNINGSSHSLSTRGGKCGVLASGASFCIFADVLDVGTVMTDDFFLQLWIDINGQKGPNIYGRDLFSMYVYPDGVIDDYMVNPECRINGNCNGGGTVRNYRENLFAECLSNAGSTIPKGCFGKILNDNWEMNY